MTDALAAAFDELRREYLAEAPARLTELRKDIEAHRAGEPGALESIRRRFHRLAGSGGSYGFPEISAVARETERWIHDGAEGGAERLDLAVARLSEAFDRAFGALETTAVAEVRPAEFAGEAVLVATPGPIHERIHEALQLAGLSVRVAPVRALPTERPSERPGLLVIATAAGEGDPTSIAAAWTAQPATRPRAVVVIETGRSVNRLRAVTAGIDAVIPADELEVELPRFARTLARVGTPPAKLLLVDGPTGALAAALQQSPFRLAVAEDLAGVPELLARESPDLVLLSVSEPTDDTLALVRLIRTDPLYQFLPVIVAAGSATLEQQLAALRAGVDDLLLPPLDPRLLVQVVASRAERGRRLREAVHRDPLTGLLNHATLMAELESAVAYARRHGGPLAFLVVDIDHFRRINDRYGHETGDQVLVQLADRFRAVIRASDVLGRYGGETFAVLLRGGGGAGATLLAGKLRHLVQEQPPASRDGGPIPLTLSAGWAAYPVDGDSAAALARAADRALHQAKTGGRDRVEGGKGGG